MTLKSGKLGNADLAAGANTVLYTCGSGAGNTAIAATVTVAICNRGDVNALVRLAVCAGDAPAAGEYLEYDVLVPPKGVLERGGIVLSATERVVARSSLANVSARVMGFEK